MERKKQKLTDVCTIQYGYAFDSKKFSDDSENIALIRIRDVKSGVSNTYYAGEYDKSYLIKEGEILVGMDGEFNIAKWKSDPALLNQRVCKISGKDNIVEDYLQYYLSLELKNIERRTSFVTVKHLSAKELNALTLEIHTYEEQKKIANQLKLTESIIEKRKQQLSDLDNLIKSQFVEMFGDTVTNPLGWEEHRLDEYIEFLTSGSRGWAQYFVDNKNELFITIKNVKNNHITLDDIQYIDAPNNKEAERTKVKTGDLLISITADLGRTGVVGEDIAATGAYINQHLSLVRLNKEKVNPLFVSYFLETEGGKRQFESKNQNGVKAGLNFDAIKSLRILVPSMDKQEEYLEFVQQVDKLKVEVQKSLDKTQVLFDSLMQQYFE